MVFGLVPKQWPDRRVAAATRRTAYNHASMVPGACYGAPSGASNSITTTVIGPGRSLAVPPPRALVRQ